MTTTASSQSWALADLPLHKLLSAGRRITREQCGGSVRLAILGDCATQHYRSALEACLRLRGVWTETYEAEFDMIRHEALDPASGLYQHAPEVVVLFPCVQTFARHVSSLSAGARHQAASEVPFVELWSRIKNGTGAVIVQHLLAVPAERPYGNQTLTSADSLAAVVGRLNGALARAAVEHGVRIIDTEAQASYFGKRQWFDHRLWCQARQALSPAFLPPLAKSASDTILADRGSFTKCVILDLDNTLWGGILGDDGAERIDIGQTEVGLAFQLLQSQMLELAERGLLLAVCSKNDETAVRRVLLEHPDMLLRPDHFAAIVANYEDKASNIRAIQAQLNIGFDSMVFLDDSPFERDWVRQSLPDVQVPELPDDPAAVLAALPRWNLFEGHRATGEDARRARFYQDDTRRRDLLASAASIDDYLQGLEMKAEIRGFDGYSLPRVHQLVQRSNQFNLTTIRYTQDELQAMVGVDDLRGVTVRLEDRLGDNGVVAVAIVRQVGDDALVDTWIMSCRVLGRGVEELTLGALINSARELGCRRLIGRYVPTAKNALVAGLYQRLGFTLLPGDAACQEFVVALDNFNAPSHSIQLITAEDKEHRD